MYVNSVTDRCQFITDTLQDDWGLIGVPFMGRAAWATRENCATVAGGVTIGFNHPLIIGGAFPFLNLNGWVYGPLAYRDCRQEILDKLIDHDAGGSDEQIESEVQEMTRDYYKEIIRILKSGLGLSKSYSVPA